MGQLLVTILLTLLFFALFFGAIGLGIFCGRVRKRRCACAAAREVMRLCADRQKAARQAQMYHPKTVDARQLPILPESLVREERR